MKCVESKRKLQYFKLNTTHKVSAPEKDNCCLVCVSPYTSTGNLLLVFVLPHLSLDLLFTDLLSYQSLSQEYSVSSVGSSAHHNF